MLGQYLTHAKGRPTTILEANAIVDFYDTDGDGKLSREEAGRAQDELGANTAMRRAVSTLAVVLALSAAYAAF